MQIDKFGNEVGYEKRLLDIKNRYKETSEEYQNSKRLIETLIKNRKSWYYVTSKKYKKKIYQKNK